jgi:ferredoxin
MKIDSDKCTGCGNCIYYCPMDAIYIGKSNNKKVAIINDEECVECGLCLRMMNLEAKIPILRREVCPTSAFYQNELTYPRILRETFSNPTLIKEATEVAGRGTEEVKTINVTHRVKDDEAGFNIELGRPGIGTRFSEIEKMTVALAETGVEFELNNPLTSLMKDTKKGLLRDEVKSEKVLSAIIEFKTPLNKVGTILDTVSRVKVNTVFVIGVYSVCDKNGSPLVEKYVRENGYETSFNGKINFGLVPVMVRVVS